MNTSQPGALGGMEEDGVVGLLSMSAASKQEDIAVPFSPALTRPHPEYRVQSWFF